MKTAGRAVGGECRISHTAPVRRDDRLEWTGTYVGQREVDVTMAFTWPGGRYRRSARPWLLAFLPTAMRSGRRRLVVDGAVDAGTLAGLMEWQELHHRWWPDTTRVVEIRADVEPAPKVRRGAGSVTAFSGGVDSAFTLLRHRPSAPPGAYRQTRLSSALMVHGFDMTHRSNKFFPAAWERSRRMIEAHGVEPLQMWTDLRKVGRHTGQHWGSVGHGAALAAALACVEQRHDRVLIPSSYPYDRLIPWGSTPMSDPLLGSAARPIWHDGAAFDKLDKVLAVAHDPAVAADLRVCFTAREHDRNCGRCFKCLSTQACFWIAGVPHPPAFDVAATAQDLAGIVLSDGYKVSLARRMLTASRARGLDDVASSLATALRSAGEEPDAD